MLDLRLAVSDDPIGEYPVNVRCKNHKDKNRPNLAVYRSNLHCFVCGFHLELRNLTTVANYIHPLAYLLGVSNEEAVAMEPKYDSATVEAYRDRVLEDTTREPLPTALGLIYSQLLYGRRKSRLPYLYERGLNDYAIRDTFLIGHDGNRFTIPVYDADGKLLTIRYRRDDEFQPASAPKYSGIKGRNGRYAYPEFLLPDDEREFIVLVEGELDAVRLWQDDVPALSVTNGAGQVPWLPEYIKETWPRIQDIIIATDQDEAGQFAAVATKRKAEELGFRSVDVMTWEEGKDVTEHLRLIGGIGNSQFSSLYGRRR